MKENVKALTVYDRCGDEWMTAGMDGVLMSIAGPSIESAMNVTGIFDQQERARVYDQVKLISRAVARASRLEREKARAKEQSG